jgi:hypothetical protein
MAVTKPKVAGEVTPELTPQAGAGGMEFIRGQLTSDARELVSSVNAGAPMPDLDAKLRQMALDNDVEVAGRTAADVVGDLRQKAQVQPMSPEELNGYIADLEKVQLAARNANTPLDAQLAVNQLNAVEAQNDVPLSNDSANLREIADELMAQNPGLDPKEAAKLAVVVAADRTGERIKGKESETEVPQLTESSYVAENESFF